MHEKISAAEKLLSRRGTHALRYVASVRNQIVHDERVTALPDRAVFIGCFETARAETQAVVDKKNRKLRAAGAGGGCIVS